MCTDNHPVPLHWPSARAPGQLTTGPPRGRWLPPPHSVRSQEGRPLTHALSHLPPRLWLTVTSFQRASTTYKSWKLLIKIMAKDGAAWLWSFISARSIARLMTNCNKGSTEDTEACRYHLTKKGLQGKALSPPGTEATGWGGQGRFGSTVKDAFLPPILRTHWTKPNERTPLQDNWPVLFKCSGHRQQGEAKPLD